jgi:predicted aspartyl protease
LVDFAEVRDVEGVVAESGSGPNLLGMTFLNRVRSVMSMWTSATVLRSASRRHT